MGAAKSIANMYTYNEYLYYYINRKDLKEVQKILELKPNLIKDPLTANSKVTALNQAVYTNNMEMVRLLIDKFNADPNLASVKGETPLIIAIRRNHFNMVSYLLEKGADPDYVDRTGLKTVEYAILQGLYRISFLLYPKLKDPELRPAEEYYDIAKTFNYRYVKYEDFLADLLDGVEPEVARDFLTKKRIILDDPVIDPTETWSQWFSRNLEFRDPPLVERSSLPQHLRPENRRFGKFGNFISRMTMTPMSQKPSYKPTSHSQMALQETNFKIHDNNQVHTVN